MTDISSKPLDISISGAALLAHKTFRLEIVLSDTSHQVGPYDPAKQNIFTGTSLSPQAAKHSARELIIPGLPLWYSSPCESCCDLKIRPPGVEDGSQDIPCSGEDLQRRLSEVWIPDKCQARIWTGSHYTIKQCSNNKKHGDFCTTHHKPRNSVKRFQGLPPRTFQCWQQFGRIDDPRTWTISCRSCPKKKMPQHLTETLNFDGICHECKH